MSETSANSWIILRLVADVPERGEFKMSPHRTLAFGLSMIFSENRSLLFRIMLRSVPTALDVAAEHFVVEIGAAVAQNLVESVPVAGPPRFTERDIRGQDLLLLAARGTGDRPARMTDDQALAFKELAALGSDAVGAGDVDRIGVRGGHRENVGHRFAPFGLAGNRHPVGRHADDVRALQRGEPIGFGEPAVVADRHADAADRGMEHREAEIARLEVKIRFVPEMDLAKCPDVTGWPDQHRAVEQPIAV